MTAPSLVEFLHARIAEDEESARWCAAGHGVRWNLREVGHEMVDDETGSEVINYDGVRDISTAEHIARHDPARVLAECEAKRRIVEEVTAGVQSDVDLGEPLSSMAAAAAERALLWLALPFADHPDYRQEWKP